MDKRGISPLIATVLIIGFTIVLAVLVITWISGTVNEQTEDTDCMVEAENVCLDAIGTIDGTWSPTSGDWALTSTGSESFEMLLIAYNDSGATETPYGTNLTGYGSVSSSSPTMAALPVADHLRVIPLVKLADCSTECDPIEIG